jgi:hypothetical protein
VKIFNALALQSQQVCLRFTAYGGSGSVEPQVRNRQSAYGLCAVFLRHILPAPVAFLRNDATQSPYSGW